MKNRPTHSLLEFDYSGEKCIEKLLALGGTRERQAVVFGPANQFQLVFSWPTRLKPKPRITVGFRSPVGWDELKAQLNRANRKLWDKTNDQPAAEYRAITDAAGLVERVGDLPRDEVTPRLAWELYNALGNLLACCQNGRKLAIAWTVYEQLTREASEQASTIFDVVSESPNVRRLKNTVLRLAQKLERPPNKRELREACGWTQDQQKEFNRVLSHASLTWLPSH